MIKQKSLTKAQLQSYSFAGKSGSDMIFDFSRINKRFYHMIIVAIKKYGVKHISSIGFSLDLYYESYKSEFPTVRPQPARKVTRSSKPHVEPTILAESAFRKIPQMVDHLLNVLDNLLSQTKTIETLTFRSFQLTTQQIELLSKIIEKNNSITKLVFDNVTLFDEGFSIIARSLHHQGLKSLHLKYCGLTDTSIDDLKSLLSYHVSLQREAEWRASLEIDGVVSTICLTTLDLQNNLFSVRLLMEISDILADMPLTLLDVRNNQPIDDRIAANIRKNIPHVSIRINSSRKKKKKLLRKKKMKVIKESNEGNDDLYLLTQQGNDFDFGFGFERKTKPDQEIGLPKFHFARNSSASSVASNKSEEIMLAKGVCVVGKRANEFSQYIQDLCFFAEEIVRSQERRIEPVVKVGRRANSVTRKQLK